MNGRRGRPATDIVVESRSVSGLGLEIDVDYVAATVVDLGGETRLDVPPRVRQPRPAEP